MGAFVGVVTSPFFRRRKGRIGNSVFTEKVAPPLINSLICRDAVANRNGVIIAGEDVTAQVYYRSADGCLTWTSHDLPETAGFSRFSRTAACNNPLFPAIFLNSGDRNAALSASRITKIDENGLNPINVLELDIGITGTILVAIAFNHESTIAVAGAPDYFNNGAISFFFRGPSGEDIDSIGFPATAGCNATCIIPIFDNDEYAKAVFMISTGNPDKKLYKLRLKFGTWRLENIPNPNPAKQINYLAQYGPTIVGVGETNHVIYSIDFGATFNLGSMPPEPCDLDVVWRSYGKFFAGSTFTPTGFLESRFGAIWIRSQFQPSNQSPVRAFCNMPEGGSFLFSTDGFGGRQCYQLRIPGEI